VTPPTLLKLLLLSGVVLLVIAIGLRARLRQPLLVLRRPRLALRAVLAMYAVLPLLVLLVVALLPLRPGVGAALLALAVSPVLPPWAKKGSALGGADDYVIGVQLLSCAVSLLVVPLMIGLGSRLFGVETVLAPWAVETVLLVTVAAPLAVGLALARLRPAAAPRLAALAEKAGSLLLLPGVVALLALQARAILAAVGQGTIALILGVVAVGLLVGHALGGPEPGQRWALASATVSRHPAVALLLASGAMPAHQPTVLGTVLLYLIASLLLPIPFERRRRQG
jgi:BASS family bile acid:Na+ symporter